VQTKGENRPFSNSSWTTRQPAEISYPIRIDTLEHRPVGIPRHTDIDEADKTCLQDAGIQLKTDSIARLRIFISLFWFIPMCYTEYQWNVKVAIHCCMFRFNDLSSGITNICKLL